MKSDHELIKDFQAGQDAAFDELVKRHIPNVYAFFMRITGDPMESEDQSQEVFLKCYRTLRRFRFEAAFTTYLYRVNANQANTWLRRNRWRQLLHLDQIPLPEPATPEVTGDSAHEELWMAVARLPKQQRLVVLMRVSQQLAYKEIAAILGVSASSAKVAYHHAVRKLKSLLGDQPYGS